MVFQSKSSDAARNYRFYRNGNFCRETYVCKTVAETKVNVLVVQ